MPLAGKREVFFEANGVPRVVEVADKKAELVVGKKAVRERADLSVLGSVGAPMAGTIIEVCIKPGSTVKPGQQLVVMNAMKMETAICAPVAGVVTQVGGMEGAVVVVGVGFGGADGAGRMVKRAVVPGLLAYFIGGCGSRCGIRLLSLFT